jgi:hypothetical protein
VQKALDKIDGFALGGGGVLPNGTITGDIIRWNSVTSAWESKSEPLAFTQIILTPALAAILDVEGGMWYKSTDKSVYVCTAV